MELHRMTHEERPAGRALYRRSFPARERQSWSQLERLQKAGRAEILTVDDGGFRGVLIMFLSRDLILGGFLSILPQKRNGGLGAAVIQAIRERYAGKPVCLEIEDPEEPGAPNAELRRRRRNFYLRNGIVPIDKMRVYDTDMELLATDERVTFEAYRAVLCSVLGTPYVGSHLERR